MESSPLNVRLPDRLRLELRTVARLEGVSESVVAREALRRHLSEKLRELTKPESGRDS